MLHVHMNFHGLLRKSYVPHTTFLKFWLLIIAYTIFGEIKVVDKSETETSLHFFIKKKNYTTN